VFLGQVNVLTLLVYLKYCQFLAGQAVNVNLLFPPDGICIPRLQSPLLRSESHRVVIYSYVESEFVLTTSDGGINPLNKPNADVLQLRRIVFIQPSVKYGQAPRSRILNLILICVIAVRFPVQRELGSSRSGSRSRRGRSC